MVWDAQTDVTKTDSGTLGKDTADPLIPPESPQLTLTVSQIGRMRSPVIGGPVNLTGKNIGFWFKFNEFVKLGAVTMAISESTDYTNSLVTTSDSKDTAFVYAGEWVYCSYAVSDMSIVGTGVNLANINDVRVSFQCVQSTLIAAAALIEYWDPPAKAKCVLWFDDGTLPHWTDAAPKLIRYGFPGVIAVNCDNIDKDVGFAMTLAQVKKLVHSHGWQVASHARSNSDHNNASLTELPLEQSLAWMRHWQMMNGLPGGDDMSYYGNGVFVHTKPECRKDVSKYGRSARLAIANHWLTKSVETLPVGDPYRTRAVMPAGNTGAQIIAYVDKAITAKGLAQFVWHNNVTGGDGTAMDELLAYLDTKRDVIDVVTAADALAR